MKNLAAFLMAAAALTAAGSASAQITGDRLAQLFSSVGSQAGLAPVPAAATVTAPATGTASEESAHPGAAKFAVAEDNPAASPKLKALWRERARRPKAKTTGRSFGRF